MTPEEAATKRRKQEKKRKRREQPLSVAKTSSTTQLARSVPGDVSEAAVVSLATAHGGAPKAHKQAGAPEGAQNRPKKAKKPKFAPGQTSQASEAVSLQKDAATAKPTSFRASLPNGLQQHYCAVGDRTLAQSRPAILKQLYKEHLDTAGLSEAQVSSWRSERSITLSGTDLRPVTAFDRAGEHLGPAYPLSAFVILHVKLGVPAWDTEHPATGVYHLSSISSIDDRQNACRLSLRSPASYQELLHAISHTGTMLANCAIRTGCDWHCCNWLGQDPCLRAASHLSHFGAVFGWVQSC